MPARKNILALVLISLTIASVTACKQETCTQSCANGIIYFVAVGFTRTQLSGSILRFYTPDNSFSHYEFSDTLSVADIYTLSGDTTSDTLIFGALSMANGSVADEVFVIPATNLNYQISNLNISGNLTEQLPCNEGSIVSYTPVGQGCNSVPYLQSYSVNGTISKCPKTSDPKDTAGIIYIHK